MKRLRMVLCGTAAVAASMLSFGCSANLGDFTLLASKNVDLEHFDSQTAEKTTAVTGEDVKMFPMFMGPPNMKEACDKAEDNGKASSLTNARIEEDWIPIFQDKWVVTGNPIPK